jgi:hypothetical protein
VAVVAQIRDLKKPDLLALAEKLGIDVHAIVDDVREHGHGMESVLEAEELELHRHSDAHPAFSGIIEFDLTFELFGKRVTRKAKLGYTFTPEWEYFDTEKNALHVGWAMSRMGLHVLTAPEECRGDEPDEPVNVDDDEKPRWVKFGDIFETGLLPRTVWDAIDEIVETRAREEDASRRKAVGLPPMP